MIPLRSPFSLIQEDLSHSEWLVLVSCVLLNRTTRKTLCGVLDEVLALCITPELTLVSDREELARVLKPLGFCSKKSVGLRTLASAYLRPDWTHAGQLPGIGQYGSRAWEMFCLGYLGKEPPRDHALVKYYHWAKARILKSKHGNI